MIDFDALINPSIQEAFGSDATYTREAGGELDIKIVIDESEEAQLRTGGAIEGWVRESDFEGTPPVKGDTVEVGSRTYTVMDVRPASSLEASGGGRHLRLREDSV